MRSAPSVTCPVGRSRFAGRLALVLWSAAALLALRAGVLAEGYGVRQALLAGAALATGVIAALAWLRAPRGELLWDGRHWHWRDAAGDDHPGVPWVALDLQRRLLVRWSAADDRTTLWLWLESDGSDRRWHALRCALHARATDDQRSSAMRPVSESVKP